MLAKLSLPADNGSVVTVGYVVMRIIFLRHAEAQPAGPDGDDAAHALTSQGRSQARRAARAIYRLGESVDLILTSPLRRADQTAKEAQRVWKGVPAEPLAALGTRFGVRGLTARLNAMRRQGVACVCLVGHAPSLEEFAGQLGCGSADAIQLSKAAAACVSLDGPARVGAGRLEWLLQRDQLARIAGKK